jgi:catalase
VPIRTSIAAICSSPYRAATYPEWDLAVQLFTEEEAEEFPFDHLDPTKIVPEELVPLKVIGRMVLDRWPDNFFAETEQVAFCPANIIPGIDFSNDPLLQGRLFSYLDTQLSRLGGPNFHQIPINAPHAGRRQQPTGRAHADGGAEGTRGVRAAVSRARQAARD